MSQQPKEARIPLALSMDDPEPMYAQIEAQLRDFILSGELPEETKLPSVRALAGELSCSVITTRRAYQDLEQGGLIRTRQGMGTVVAPIAEDKKEVYRREPVTSALGEAIRAGKRAGFSETEIREMFEEALEEGEDVAGAQ